MSARLLFLKPAIPRGTIFIFVNQTLKWIRIPAAGQLSYPAAAGKCRHPRKSGFENREFHQFRTRRPPGNAGIREKVDSKIGSSINFVSGGRREMPASAKKWIRKSGIPSISYPAAAGKCRHPRKSGFENREFHQFRTQRPPSECFLTDQALD